MLENVPMGEPPEATLGRLDEARLYHEVMYHRAAKQGKVPVVLYDSWEAMADGEGQLIGIVPVGQLSWVFTVEVLEGILEALEFNLGGLFEPYVIPESEWAGCVRKGYCWRIPMETSECSLWTVFEPRSTGFCPPSSALGE